jgi:hypothetical protein
MILPQSEAYRILSSRLTACSSLHAHLGYPPVNLTHKTDTMMAIPFSIEKAKDFRKGTTDKDKSALSGGLDVTALVEFFSGVHMKRHQDTVERHRPPEPLK